MIERNDYIASLETRLGNWDSLLNVLKTGRRNAADGMTEEYSRAIHALEAKREQALDKLRELRDAPEDSEWETLREGADHLWHEITDTLERTKAAFLEGLNSEHEPEPDER